MKYIGVDLGSTYIKAVLLDPAEQRIVSQKKYHSPEKLQNPNINKYEVSAVAYVDKIKGLIDEYTQAYPDVEGLIISTQMHGFVYSVPDMEDIYVSWQDMRCLDEMPGKGKSYLAYLGEQISQEDMRKNGVYLKPSLGICNLYVLLDEDSSIPRGGTLYTLGSYIIHALTGMNICHITNAAPLGIVDLPNKKWDDDLLRKLEMDAIKKPKLAAADYQVCGIYESNGCEIKVYPDYGDMQVSMLGSGLKNGEVAVNVGTGAQVISREPGFCAGDYENRPYFENSYLKTISNMPGGRNLDVLVNFLHETAEQAAAHAVDIQNIWKLVHASDMDTAAGLQVETGFYANPYFPDGGAIKGINQNNFHVDTLFCAAYTDMAQTYWHYIHKLKESEDDIQRIIFSGGVSWKSPELIKFMQKISGKECCLSPMEDEALAGMYYLSLLCSRICSDTEECAMYSLA